MAMLKIAGEFNRGSVAFTHRNPASGIFSVNRAFYKLAEKTTPVAEQRSTIIAAIKGVNLIDSIPKVAKAFREIFSTYGIDNYSPEAIRILRKAGITPSLTSWYIYPEYIGEGLVEHSAEKYERMRSLLEAGGYSKTEAVDTVNERQGSDVEKLIRASKHLVNCGYPD